MRSSGNDFQDLCIAFGLMTLSWAWAENILASTIGVINKNAGPFKSYPEAPLGFVPKGRAKRYIGASASPKRWPRLGGTLHRAFPASQ